MKTKDSDFGGKQTYPTLEEMRELNSRRLKGDLEAREEMIVRNMALVRSIASQFRNENDPDYNDWLAAGHQGLTRAVDKFDPKKGRFSTYAYQHIHQRMFRRHENESRTIRLPIYFQKTIARLRRVATELEQALDRRPTLEEISEETSLSVAQISHLFAHAKGLTSLDQSVVCDTDSELYRFVPNAAAIPPDLTWTAVDEAHQVLRQIQDLRGYLEERETIRNRDVFFIRYGLFVEEEGKTLQETGDMFGITRERTRQICAKIFRHRFRRNLPIATEVALLNSINCIEMGMEIIYATTGKVNAEMAEVILGPRK